MPVEVDILEDSIFRLSPELLNNLLKDHTTSKEDIQRNIFWATSDYEYLGEGYQYDSPILPSLITGDNGHVIMPRILKSRDTQTARSREMAEVFTPSWICNAQNNLIDEAWFGRKDVFNTEYTDEQGCHRWRPNSEKIQFPEGKTWKDYVRDNRLEITCGEAPYIISRYDTTTGEAIPLEQRIGLLDRKLRVVGENTETSGEWLEWAQEAYKSVQLLQGKLSRENLMTVSPGGIAGAEGDIYSFDGNPAGTAGMAEMLVQNHEGYVEFLPCLPVEWKDGSFKGLCLKGGAEATAEWTNAVINKASLKATVDQVLKVKVPQGKKYRVLLNSKEAIANPDAKGLITVEMKRGDLLELL